MENKYQINKICFEKTVYPYCPMGNALYEAVVRVSLEPTELFDFVEVDKQIEKLSGESLIIEALTDEVCNLLSVYKPAKLLVQVEAHSNVHFPVTVEKYM
jgi:hypothetical protein